MLPNVKWLTVEEVANYARCSRMTVYRWIKNGDLPATRFGSGRRNFRITETALLALMSPAASE